VPGLIHATCLVAGYCDFLTGVLLLAAPAFTLASMGVTATPAEPILLRFVGVFVASVGFSYLYPWLLDPRSRLARVRTVFEVTALVRLAVAAFVGAGVLGGALEMSWSTVAATDLAFAAVQIAALRRWPGEVAGR
jgi:quinol-cytochrome oxidoreductase complex cytochrome b subunit